MKQNKLFLGLATLFAVAFTFTACSSDDAETQNSEPRTIRLTSSLERGSTRSTSDPQSGTLLSASSNLAIWAINQTGSAALTNGNNEQYSVDGSGNLTPKTSDNTMTWPDGATLDFYAYAPYKSNYSYSAANTFSVQTDQSTEADYLASDLVLAQATGKAYNANTPVALPFKHLLSKINITINKLDGSNVDLSDASVTITNTKIATTFTPNAAEDEILGEASNVTNITAVADLNGAGTACAVLVPQTINAGTELVKIVAGTKTLIAKLGTTTTLESGKSYSFTVKVGTVADDTPAVVTVVLGVASITEWNSTDNTLGAVSFPKWFADFKPNANNYTWDSTTKAFGWTASSNNVMDCFDCSKGVLVNYKSVVIKVSDCETGEEYRVLYYLDNQFTSFNADAFGNKDAKIYSGGIKIIDLEKLMDSSHHNKNLSDVTKISLGGGSSSGSVTIDYFYISTLSASDEKTALGDGTIIPNS